MALAGVNHITIAPALLQQLTTAPASSAIPSLFDQISPTVQPEALLEFSGREAAFRIAFTRRDNGEGERKLSQAINIFCDMQTKLETMMAQARTEA